MCPPVYATIDGRRAQTVVEAVAAVGVESEVVVAALRLAGVRIGTGDPLLMVAHHEDRLRRVGCERVEPVGLFGGDVTGGRHPG